MFEATGAPAPAEPRAVTDDLLRALASALAANPAALAEVLQAARLAPVVPVESPPLRRLLRQYRDALPTMLKRSRKPLADGTRDLYRKHIGKPLMRTVIDAPRGRMPIGWLLWSEVTPKTADAYRLSRRAMGIQDSSINRELTTLMACLTWHIDSGAALGRNPMRGHRMVDESNCARKTRLTYDEYCHGIRFASPLVQDIARCQYLCGTRPTEMRELRIAELDQTGRRVVHMGERVGAKTGERTFPVPDEAWEIIQARRQESRGEYVFIHEKDPTRAKPIGAGRYCREIGGSFEAAGMEGVGGERLVPYHGRHGGAGDIAEDSPIADASAALGASVSTLQKSYLNKFAVHIPMQERMRARMNARRAPRPATVPAKPAKSRRG